MGCAIVRAAVLTLWASVIVHSPGQYVSDLPVRSLENSASTMLTELGDAPGRGSFGLLGRSVSVGRFLGSLL